MSIIRIALVTLSLCVVAACSTTPTSTPSITQGQDDVAALSAAIQALGPDVDPAEATRAAQLAFSYTRVLADRYDITDGPLVHNMKVNAGIKDRGLCWHWAEDIETRLMQEQFQTLTLHRAIAEHPVRIDHSTAIIGAAGSRFDEGIVLDPWRNGGTLHWVPVAQDDRYDWQERVAVLLARQERKAP